MNRTQQSSAFHSCPQPSHRTPAGVTHMPELHPPTHTHNSLQEALLLQPACAADQTAEGSWQRLCSRPCVESFASALVQGDSCNSGLLGMLPSSLSSWRWRRGLAGLRVSGVCSGDPRPEGRMVVRDCQARKPCV